MMKRTHLLLALSMSSFFFFVSEASAQEINAYSVIDYDSATNTLDGFAYTAPSYELATYYSATVTASIHDDNGYTFGQGSQTKTDGSWAQVEMIVPGNGCRFYTITADHIDHAEYYLYYVDGGYEEGYYDPYNFTYFEEFASEEPYWGSASFFGLGPTRIKSFNEGNATLLGTTTEQSSGSCNLAPEVQIKRNDNIVIASNRTNSITQTVIVGQKIQLSTTVNQGGSVSSREWTVPGTKVASFNTVCNLNVQQQCAEPTTGTVVPLTNFGGSAIDYYWVTGGNGFLVLHTVNIGGTEYTIKARFNVKQPTATISTQSGSPQISTLNAQPALSFGSPASPGVRFTASTTIPSPFNGQFYWVQIWDKNRTLSAVNSGNLVTYASIGTGIDTRLATSGSVHTDQPGIIFNSNHRNIAIDDCFQMYYMFQPTVAEGGILVPLRVINWGWFGEASSSDGANWSLNPTSQGQVTSNQVTTDFPEWTRNAVLIPFNPVGP